MKIEDIASAILIAFIPIFTLFCIITHVPERKGACLHPKSVEGHAWTIPTFYFDLHNKLIETTGL